MKIPKRWSKVALLPIGIGGLGLGLLIAEGGIRFLDLLPLQRRSLVVEEVQSPPLPGAKKSVRGRLHPFRGWMIPPGARSSFALEDRDQLYPGGQITSWAEQNAGRNALGFYSAVEDYRAIRPEDFVVAVFGGSVASQLSVLAGDILAQRIEAELPSSGFSGSVRVLNLAEGGYKQPQQLFLLIEMLLLGVVPNVVVNIDGFNEIVNGMADCLGGDHPLHPSRQHYKTMVGLALRAPSEKVILLASTIIRNQKAATRVRDIFSTFDLLGRSELAKAAAGALVAHFERGAAEAESALQQSFDGGNQRDLPLAPLPIRGAFDSESCSKLIGRIWAESSMLMSVIAQNSGASYVHVLQPNQYVPDGKPLTEAERATAWRADGPEHRWVPEGYTRLRRWASELRGAGVSFHDLSMVFGAIEETLYVDRCCHLNWLGNQILARSIGEVLPIDARVFGKSSNPESEPTSGQSR